MDWKQQAFEMYFGKHMKIANISEETGISRQHISRYLQQFTQFKVEKEWRKKQNLARRRKSKRLWDREHRERKKSFEPDRYTIQREHEEAVRVLSHEKY